MPQAPPELGMLVPSRTNPHCPTHLLPQGSPLVPDDLRLVAASAAAATVLVSDSSR